MQAPGSVVGLALFSYPRLIERCLAREPGTMRYAESYVGEARPRVGARPVPQKCNLNL